MSGGRQEEQRPQRSDVAAGLGDERDCDGGQEGHWWRKKSCISFFILFLKHQAFMRLVLNNRWLLGAKFSCGFPLDCLFFFFLKGGGRKEKINFSGKMLRL